MDKAHPSLASVMTPAEAADRLEELHAEATMALREALERYFDTREPPSPAERARFRYP
jgi:AMP nucleosidase